METVFLRTKLPKSDQVQCEKFHVGVRWPSRSQVQYFIPLPRYNPHSFISLFYGDHQKHLIDSNFESIAKHKNQQLQKKQLELAYRDVLEIPAHASEVWCGLCGIRCTSYKDHIQSPQHTLNLERDPILTQLRELSETLPPGRLGTDP